MARSDVKRRLARLETLAGTDLRECTCPRVNGTRWIVTHSDEEAGVAQATFEACHARHAVDDKFFVVRRRRFCELPRVTVGIGGLARA